MSVVSIYWPADEKGEGFVFGWRTKTYIVVCGVAAFTSVSYTQITLVLLIVK